MNETRMRIEVGVPFFKEWNSDQKLFEEIISGSNVDYAQMIKFPQKAENL